MSKVNQNKLSLFVQKYKQFVISCKNKRPTIFNNDSFPNVKCASIKFNDPEASSAHSERLFSGEKIIFETIRTSLKDANFEKLLLLSVNKDF